MVRNHDMLAKGKYPVYVGEFADGTTKALSFPTSAKLYSSAGIIEFARGRRLVEAVKNPPTIILPRDPWKRRALYLAAARSGGPGFRRMLNERITARAPSSACYMPRRRGALPFMENPLPPVPLVRGWVILSATAEKIPDPMDAEPVKQARGPSAKQLKKLVNDLAYALANRVNDVDELLERARQMAA